MRQQNGGGLLDVLRENEVGESMGGLHSKAAPVKEIKVLNGGAGMDKTRKSS